MVPNIFGGFTVNTDNNQFTNREYAHWIKEFQRKNPDTISFSNKLDTLNKNSIKIVSLKPLKIETSEISSHDFEQIGLLEDYFDHLCKEVGLSGSNSILISISGTLYSLHSSIEGGERVIRVIDVKDNTDEKPSIVII